MKKISLLFAVCLLGPGAASQDPVGRESSLPSRSGVVPVAGVANPDPPLVPPPPRSAFQAPPPKQTPTLRFLPGAAKDLAPGPESVPGGGAQTPQSDALVLIENSPVIPGGSTRSHVAEPTTSISRDTALFTANWYAGLSSSSGKTWTLLDPYTMFPASDGGFCCDQWTLYVPPPYDLTIWLLQYSYSATTGTGRQRIAVARGRDALLTSSFYYYDITPALAGRSGNLWFDFPHLASSSNFLFMTTNVYTPANALAGSAVFRFNLGDLRLGGGVRFDVVNGGNTIFDSASHRLCYGCTTTMYYGGHQSTIFGAPVIRIWSWDDSSTTVTSRDRGISAWYTGLSIAPGPDARMWLDRDDHRIQGGYFAQGAISFLWGSNAGGAFPRPFVRVAGFSPAQNFNVVGEASIWNATSAFAYPSVSVNARQELGGTIAFGGGSLHPGTAAFVVDSQSGWAPLTNVVFAAGGRGPDGGVWGDYQSSAAHSHHPTTYVGSGFSIDAGGTCNPKFAWFGRLGDVPTFATVNVTSTPFFGVALTVDVMDRNGQQNGTSNFTRTYAPHQGMTWRAPAVTSNHVFDRWVWNGAAQPQGQTNLSISTLGGVTTHSIEARYIPNRVLLVDSANPSTGVPISNTPTDRLGINNGTTAYNLFYSDGTAFTLTAPATFNGAPFDRWYLDNTPWTTNLVFSGIADADHRVTAVYRVPQCGAFTPYGTSCNGSGFFPLEHGASTTRRTCGPWIGDTVTFGMGNAFTSGAALLLIGASDRSWNGLRLPLPVPGYPGCSIYTDMVVTIGTPISGRGAASVAVPLPVNPALVNQHLYTQFVGVDASANLQFTNGVDTLIGGFP